MKLQLVHVRSYDENFEGTISIIEQADFPVKRVFWITELYPKATRANHAHKKLRQFIVPLRGECKIKAFKVDGSFEFFRMNNPKCGLDVPPGHWLKIYDMDRSTVLLVLASEAYDKEDYINDPQDFFKHGIPDTF
jgi:dTDP-4-dehydrorhamnose 3,5-epimerase-like enzyme